MKQFEFLIKDFDKILLEIFSVPEISSHFYQIWAFNKEMKPIGYLGFEILRKYHQADLRGINVDPKYLQKGVGSSMNKLFEQFALQNDCQYIKGIYAPFGEGAAAAAKFYKRNRYHISIEDDTFAILEKTIYKMDSDVPQFIESAETDFLPHAEWDLLLEMQQKL